MSTALNASLLKALEILDLFSAEQAEISAGVVAQQLNMSQATAHRFLLTLEHGGLLVSPRRGQFTLGQKLEELGKLAFEISPLPSLARPVVDGLSRELNESVMACRMGRRGPVCVASANSRRPIRVSVDVGTELPLTRTAQGKLFLAAMDRSERLTHMEREARGDARDLTAAAVEAMEAEIADVQEHGRATNFGENEAEIAAIAVPVTDPQGQTLMTLSVFGIMSGFDEALRARALKALRSGAEALQANLRNRGKDRLSKLGKPA